MYCRSRPGSERAEATTTSRVVTGGVAPRERRRRPEGPNHEHERQKWPTPRACLTPQGCRSALTSGRRLTFEPTGNVKTGRLSFTSRGGLSLLNYLAPPRMHADLPREMSEVQRIYTDRAPAVALGYVWWHVIGPVTDWYRRRYDPALSDEDASAGVAATPRAGPDALQRSLAVPTTRLSDE